MSYRHRAGSSAVAFASSFQLAVARFMAVMERLAHLTVMVDDGYAMHVAVSSAAQRGRGKIKITTHGRPNTTSAVTRVMLKAVLGAVMELAMKHVAVDRRAHT